MVADTARQGRGRTPEESVALALNTSGRAVLFAGITVVIALLGMFMLNLDFVRSIAVFAVLAVFMTMLASPTLPPALLGFCGRNIDRFGLPHRKTAEANDDNSFWYRWSRFIQYHPWPSLIVSVALLVGLALPVFALRLGFGDAGNLPESDTPRKAYDLSQRASGPASTAPSSPWPAPERRAGRREARRAPHRARINRGCRLRHGAARDGWRHAAPVQHLPGDGAPGRGDDRPRRPHPRRRHPAGHRR
ncbi:MAG TPA: MMPL family transporter [Dehalococcoidia bacterium]|nr:MMPL family transporter [Dehalococcoidia bacterium]